MTASGGPGDGGPVIRVYRSGEWSYERRGPSIPLLGVFLIALGALLLIEQLAPNAATLGFGGVVLAVGIAMLISWWRGGWGLYPGMLLVALSLPGVLIALGVIPDRDGYSTLLLGLGLLAVSLARLHDGRGAGWQGLVGLVLVLLAAASLVAWTGVGSLLLPALLIAFGLVVILRR
ncbi:MAG TPA: hypothetical protein VEY67_06645 [Candidatus Dormibacteraeota bacterium]|nr:hypothetical protein [Candidatus Dormibacteraeota bacterium]